ncbi:MAG: hypothetical protein L6R35_004157 [Caloplaca aegaea]|nr:MAG: hypothetical protein L6R35_004157 [Caloplaca aegaea]
MATNAPPFDDPNFDLYADQRGRIIGSLTAILIITTLTVALRILSRHLARAGFWPIPLLWRLRTTAKQQIVLTIIFSIAGFVLLVSIIWIVVLARLEQADVTWNYINTVIWSVLEPSMAVVCACIPSLRPLYSVAQDHELRHQHLRPRQQPRVMAASAVAQPDERWPVQPAAGGAGGG